MRKVRLATAFGLVWICLGLAGQIKRTEVPLGDAVGKALAKAILTDAGSRPFHIRIGVSEPENPQSPYQGVIEEWWVSPDQWRREVSAKGGMRQTIVVAGGNKTEQDEGDYFPLWLRSFVAAAFDPIPNPAAWTGSQIMIEQITMPNGDRSDACARWQSKIGTGERATDAFSNVCFDGEGRLKFFGSPGYGMEFHDYRGFGKKQIARRLVDHPEPGTELVGEVTLLEDEAKVKDAALFTPLPVEEDRFRRVQVSPSQMEVLSAGNPPINWPPVHSGNVRGRLAIYVSVDSKGQVREVWPLNSDNAGLEDSVRDQVRQWKMKPAVDKSGLAVAVDGGLGFAFETQIADPLPELSDAEVRALATTIVEPVWQPGSLKSGEVVEVSISVNEQGKLTGMGVRMPAGAQGAVMNALHQWTFRPLMRDGKAEYFHGMVRFTVP